MDGFSWVIEKPLLDLVSRAVAVTEGGVFQGDMGVHSRKDRTQVRFGHVAQDEIILGTNIESECTSPSLASSKSLRRGSIERRWMTRRGKQCALTRHREKYIKKPTRFFPKPGSRHFFASRSHRSGWIVGEIWIVWPSLICGLEAQTASDAKALVGGSREIHGAHAGDG